MRRWGADKHGRRWALAALFAGAVTVLSLAAPSYASLRSEQSLAASPISLQVSSPRSGQVQLRWNGAGEVSSFKIERDGQVVDGSLPSGSQSYLAEHLRPNATYSFQVIGLSPQGSAVSSSSVLSIDPDGPTGSNGKGGVVGTRYNWPCRGCIVAVPATYNPDIPTALLVALHGDEGISTIIAGAWAPVTEKANVILFAPQCPINKGCHACVAGDCSNSWWYWFQSSRSYDDAWIGQQVSVIEARYDIDRAREYITGWSGGADYLGWYALTHSSRFAAANFVVGGVPYTSSCPSRKLAAYFLLGSRDFRYLSGQPAEVARVLKGCGDPTRWLVLPGLDHDGTIAALTSEGYAAKILTWLMSHILTGSLPS